MIQNVSRNALTIEAFEDKDLAGVLRGERPGPTEFINPMPA